MKRNLDAPGYTANCLKCKSMLAGAYATRGNDSACRARIEAKMVETVEGKKRPDEAKERS
jgi:hypothetical protein